MSQCGERIRELIKKLKRGNHAYVDQINHFLERENFWVLNLRDLLCVVQLEGD